MAAGTAKVESGSEAAGDAARALKEILRMALLCSLPAQMRDEVTFARASGPLTRRRSRRCRWKAAAAGDAGARPWSIFEQIF